MKLKVKGMTCEHCEMSVKKALSNVAGVIRVIDVSREREEAIVEGDPDPGVIVEAVKQQGYSAELAQ